MMRTALNIVGPKVKKFREAMGWSQSTLATKCQLKGFDVSKATIGQIEITYRTVTDLELAILAEVLETSTDDLLPKSLPKWKPRG